MKYACLLLASATVALAASVDPTPELVKEQQHAVQASPELNRIMGQAYRMTRGRSLFETMTERVMNLFGYGDDYEDDYSGGDYFYEPSENMFGNGHSSYAFYNPYGNYHPARDDTFDEEESY